MRKQEGEDSFGRLKRKPIENAKPQGGEVRGGRKGVK